MGIGWANMQEALKGLDQKTRPVGLMEIDKTFERVLQESGAGSGGRKLKHLQDLFSSVAKEEKDFLIRLIMGEIRQGALQGLILEAIAEASSVPPERVRQGLMFSGDIGEVARVALEEGSAGLSRFQPRLFHPILPRLANPAAGEEEALARLGEVGWEYKIDGARIQIHKEGEEIRVFTRRLKEVTDSIPELVRLAGRFPARKAFFDGEAIALREDGKPFPFQKTMRRSLSRRPASI